MAESNHIPEDEVGCLGHPELPIYLIKHNLCFCRRAHLEEWQKEKDERMGFRRNLPMIILRLKPS